MRKLLTIGAALLAALSLASQSRAADVPIFPTGPVFKLSSLVWGSSSAQGFNQNFFFTPYFQQESVCVYIYNQNPTNAHPFVGQVLVTGDPTSITPSTNWQFAGLYTNLTAAIPGNSPTTFSAQISGVAQAAISLNGSTALGGSPDTANVIIIQTTGSCFAGLGVITANTVTQSATSPLQAISEAFSFSFAASNSATNPASGQLLEAINNPSIVPRTLFFDRLVISSTATATVNIETVTNSGTTCGAGSSAVNLKVGSSNSTTAANLIGTCVANPAGTVFMSNVPVSATQPTVIDLKGFLATSTPGSNFGIGVVMAAALTGTITSTFFWYDK